MKIGIVTKLFLLTTLLCMLTLSIMFIGQTLFFKQYYANQKINDIEEGIRSFKKAYLKAGEDVSIIQKLEQDFYRENNTWITSLDNKGNIKYANDFSVIIHLDDSPNKDFSNRDITIPLYSLISLEDIERGKFDLEQGNRVMIDGIKKDNTIVPAILTIEDKNAAFENKMLMDKLEKDNAFVPATLVEKKGCCIRRSCRFRGTISRMKMDQRRSIFLR
ncbi:hypothetical protein AB1L08_21770, partial [Siminovitchia sp. 179-K 8D1 HS]